MTTENGPTTTDAPQPHDRPEADDPRIIRIGVRWFRMAAEEGLTPFESAVAWKRVAHTLLREATFKVATGHLLRTLASELLEEIPGEAGGRRSEVGGQETPAAFDRYLAPLGYVAVPAEGYSCEGCAFESGGCPDEPCSRRDRWDSTSVVFQKAEALTSDLCPLTSEKGGAR